MPFLRFSGFGEEFLRENASIIISEFARVCAVPCGLVKVELLGTTPITEMPRSLEILMFERDQKRHDSIAETLHDLLCHFGYREVHIFFILLTPHLYYKEGIPLPNLP